jgi:Xaa-Pro aminopeptidase
MSSVDQTEARLAGTREWMREQEIGRLFVYSYRSALTAHWTGYCPRHSVTNASLLVITPRDALHISRLPLHVATAERTGAAISHVCAAPDSWSVAKPADMVAAAAGWLAGANGRAALAAYAPEAGIRGPLEESFGEVAVVTDDLVDTLIGPKSDGDLRRLRQAAGVAQEAFDAGIAALRVGSPPSDAVRAAEVVLRDCGSVTWHCFAGGTDGTGRSLLQAPGEVLSAGTTGFFEVIPDVEGFCPEIVSSFFVGSMDPEVARVYEVICRTLDSALVAIGPSLSFGDVFELLDDPLVAAGIAPDAITRLGHATGLDNIELPECLDPDDSRVLGPGRVISIHPNADVAGRGSLFRGGTVVVADAGCEALFRFPSGPIVIG